MRYFEQGYIDFFKGLEKNNNKEWFAGHKKDYERFVKDPFKQFVTDLIDALRKEDPDFETEPSKSIFRINRDIRFSKDKQPYNTVMKAGLVNGGRKSALPGFYLGMSAHHVGVGGGLYMVEKDGLQAIRETIADDPEAFMQLLEDKKFKSTFGELKGEAIKRIPKEWKEAHEKCPYIANKQFFFMRDDEDPSLITSEGLLDHILTQFDAGRPLVNFLNNAMNGVNA